MTEKRKPWGKWYWGDWRKDARLRRCSYAARGLWIDMLSLMGGECDRYGYLVMEGQALGPDDLAGLLGGSPRDIKKMLADLASKNVFSVIGEGDIPDDVLEALSGDMPIGAMISRRMIRDKVKEENDRRNGKGGGNPTLLKKPGEGLTPPDKAQKPEARDKKEKPDANASVKKRGSRLDISELPSDWLQWALGQGHPNPMREWLRFRDYWISTPGQKGVKLDWEATWRNWIRKSIDDNTGKRGAGRIADDGGWVGATQGALSSLGDET